MVSCAFTCRQSLCASSGCRRAWTRLVAAPFSRFPSSSFPFSRFPSSPPPPLVVGGVEAGAPEDQGRPAGDQPLGPLPAVGAFLPAVVVHRGEELLKHVPGRALIFVGRHRTTT